MSVPLSAAPASNGQIDDDDPVLSRTRRRILLLTLALVVTAAAALSYYAAVLFEDALAPEVLRKSETVAEFLASDVERAISYGIPLNKLVAVSEYFEEKRAGHPEIQFIALHGADGELLHVAGTDVSEDEKGAAEEGARQLVAGAPAESIDTHGYYLVMRPVRAPAGVAAVIVIGTDSQFVHRQLQELAYDVVVILLVSLFLAFEIAVALLVTSAVTPINLLVRLMRAAADGDLRRRISYRANDEIGHAIGRFNASVQAVNDQAGRIAARLNEDVGPDLRNRFQAIGERFGLAPAGAADVKAPPSAVDVRLPLFIFILAEELQKSFLPIYVGSLPGRVAWLSPEILIGLPISVYMLTLALATPFAGSFADRYGTRRIFLLGLIPAFAGFVGSALAATVLELIVFRALTAAGYAMCTIAAQGFIIQVTVKHERARGMSTFVGVLMAASICGTAIGGILADRIGYRAVFMCAAILALVAGALALRMLSSEAPPLAQTASSRFRLVDFWLVLTNWRFLFLLLFAAIPQKIVLTGFLFYAVPLYLASLGTSEAEIGRVMMTYSLVIVFLGSWFSRISDEKGLGWWMVLIGTLVSGLAMALLWARADIYGVLAAVLVVAVAHSASISPQLALLPEICRDEIARIGETSVLSILRMLERIGSIAGPLLVAGLVAELGFVNGLVLVGVMVAVLSLMLLLVFVRSPRSQGA